MTLDPPGVSSVTQRLFGSPKRPRDCELAGFFLQQICEKVNMFTNDPCQSTGQITIFQRVNNLKLRQNVPSITEPCWQGFLDEEYHTQLQSLQTVNPVVSQVSTVHHAASHVFAVARITLHHHGCGFEDRHGDLSHWQLLMISLLRRDDWCIGGQHEVNSRIWHQIRLEPWMLKKGQQKTQVPRSLASFSHIETNCVLLGKKQWICRYKPLPPEVEKAQKVPFPIGK